MTPDSSPALEHPRNGLNPRQHHTAREGVQLGLAVAIVTWSWVAILDWMSGTPFGTMRSLGGAATFTTIHLGLCLAYGVVIVAAVHAAMRTPSVIFAMVFCTILFQAAFVMLVAFLGELGAGSATWSRFLAGNVIAVIATCVMLARRHALHEILHRAEAET